MQPSNPSCVVALSTERNCATAISGATGGATESEHIPPKPLSLQQLRAQLRARLSRNESASKETANPAPIVGAADTAADSTSPAYARMAKVIAKLHGDPGVRFAVEAHADVDPDAVILTLAIRDKAACEIRIPRDKYDPFLLLELIERHSGRVH